MTHFGTHCAASESGTHVELSFLEYRFYLPVFPEDYIHTELGVQCLIYSYSEYHFEFVHFV